MRTIVVLGLLLALALVGCDAVLDSGGSTGGTSARVAFVIDGDTIAVEINGEEERVRYIGVNTPEDDEPCYFEAREANAALVEGRTVRLVADEEDLDRFGRMLRYVYVEDVFVNARLVEQGWAEVVSYPPNTLYFDLLRSLEREAAADELGCHPTGIFDDGSYTR